MNDKSEVFLLFFDIWILQPFSYHKGSYSYVLRQVYEFYVKF